MLNLRVKNYLMQMLIMSEFSLLISILKEIILMPKVEFVVMPQVDCLLQGMGWNKL